MGHVKITEPSVVTSELDCILTIQQQCYENWRHYRKEIEIKATNYSLDIPFDEHEHVKLLDNFLPMVEQCKNIIENSGDEESYASEDDLEEMLEELVIAEEEELTNAGDFGWTISSGTSSPTSNNHLHSPENVGF
ncbi:hypothetical protein K0M31_002636 [Melipona bicolor]|uniref:Uncharacterized protein n=1 Tax=Melipona bicolor TaxID=60889 RepID=A0AA40KYU1_9HYME|nr:hypothetical protein K0M31_002636 [Melipona bicolor]